MNVLEPYMNLYEEERKEGDLNEEEPIDTDDEDEVIRDRDFIEMKIRSSLRLILLDTRNIHLNIRAIRALLEYRLQDPDYEWTRKEKEFIHFYDIENFIMKYTPYSI